MGMNQTHIYSINHTTCPQKTTRSLVRARPCKLPKSNIYHVFVFSQKWHPPPPPQKAWVLFEQHWSEFQHQSWCGADWSQRRPSSLFRDLQLRFTFHCRVTLSSESLMVVERTFHQVSSSLRVKHKMLFYFYNFSLAFYFISKEQHHKSEYWAVRKTFFHWLPCISTYCPTIHLIICSAYNMMRWSEC